MKWPFGVSRSTLLRTTLVLTMLIGFFQNCGGSFESVKTDLSSSSNKFFGSRFTVASAPERFTTPGVFGNGHAMTWDGRVIVRTVGLSAPWSPASSGWFVSAIRPQNFRYENDRLVTDSAFSAPKLGWINEYAYKAAGRPSTDVDVLPFIRMLNALAIVKDHAFQDNPYRSDATGVRMANGGYATYKVLIYSQDYNICEELNQGCDVNAGVANHIGFFKAQIIVKDPNSATAEIASVMKTSGYVKLFSQNGQPIAGIEPTVTFDGRLMVFQIGGRLLFTFNERDGQGTGWTNPAPIAEMYNFRDRMVSSSSGGNSVRFGELYRIAQYPFRLPSGEMVRSDASFGAYPWIDLDGDELFLTTTIHNDTALRAGASVIGASTKGMLTHMDGGLNADRRSIHRLFVSSFGKAPGKWAPTDLATIPLSKKQVTMPMFQSNSQQYFEMSFEEPVAGDYDVYLPMNESLEYASNSFDYDLDSTQDTSGYFHKGTLNNGARFSDDYLNCTQSCDQKEDRFSGKAIYFEPMGSVVVPNRSAIGHTMLAGQSLSVSFALKLLREPGDYNYIVNKDGAFNVILEGNRQIQFSVQTASGFYRSGFIGPQLPLNQWVHIGLTYNHQNGEMVYYLNSQEAERKLLGVASPLMQSGADLVVGPVRPVGAGTIFVLDQLAVSPKVRSAMEISRQVTSKLPAMQIPRGLASVLPLGLSLKDKKQMKDRELNPSLVEFGKNLFADPNFSRTKAVSCATCHQPSKAWTDGRMVAVGIDGQNLKRNTQTIYNLAFYSEYFHDGRADTLQKQIAAVIQNKEEMDGNFDAVVSYVNRQPLYRPLRSKAFGSDVVTKDQVLDAIAEFMLSIMTGDSKHDRVQAGKEMFTASEMRGFQLFNGKARCADCHSGSNFSDGQFHNLGFLSGNDLGRANVTASASDKFRFRTPSLRNVALSAPYFHDGSAPNLEAVVALYSAAPRVTENPDALIQPLGLSAAEQADLVAYLKTLSGMTMEMTLPTIPAYTGTVAPTDSSQAKYETEIKFLYALIFRRAADPDGLKFWVDKRVAGISLTDVRSLMANSEESKKLLTALYQKYLLRAPDANELRSDMAKLASTQSMDQVEAQIASLAKVNSATIEAEIKNLYMILFRRAADTAGLKFWVDKRLAGLSLADARKIMANSDEEKGLVTGLYERYLQRAPTTTELTNHLNTLATTQSLDQVETQVKAMVVQPDAADLFVEKLYIVVLNRASDKAGLTFHAGRIRSAKSVAICGEVIQSFYTSTEFMNRNLANVAFVDTLYRGALMREPDSGGKTFWLNQLSAGVSRNTVISSFVTSTEGKGVCQNLINKL